MNDTLSDPVAERALLACCWHNPTAHTEAQRHITGNDLFAPVHELIWDAMLRLRRESRPVDFAGMAGVLRADGTPLGRAALEALPDILVYPVSVDSVSAGEHAKTVRSFSLRRRLIEEGTRTVQQASSLGTDMDGFAANVANRFAAVRDSGVTDDVTSKTLAEILEDPDDEPDWLVPGLLERRDRLVVTGDEGLGKSHLLRQFAICAAAGIDPWDTSHRFDPIRTAIFDCENTENQVRRAARRVVGFAAHYGRPDVAERVFLRCSTRIDITRDKDLAQIHHELDALLPDLIVIGPLYKLVPHAIQTDDEAAPVLAALDTIRDRGIAMLIEAHSGHAIGGGGGRNMRPRGSSALLGWPEFGYGLRDLGAQGRRYCEFVAWRGNRSERDFPRALRRADDGVRWVPYEGSTEVGHWEAS
jgi:hypothetical protein